MAPSKRSADFAVAAAIVVVALAISPIGIGLATGRLDLSPRIMVLSLTFDAFLLILAAAAVVTGRARRVLFGALVCVSPLVLLAATEAGAIALHLSDRIAPIEDLSIVADRDRWPAHLMSQGRWAAAGDDGLALYRPFQADGITINALGLRTAPPSPKKVGERRIAITGGSVAFGWRLRDADTIPVQLQQILHRQGHSNVTVYNFALDSIMIAQELAVLKRFREIYGIDQVIFLTGANDATYRYMHDARPSDGLAGLTNGYNAFELIKVAGRLRAMLLGPPPSLLAKLDTELLPELRRDNTLRAGVIAANDYCRAAAIRCDFVLQPLLLLRKQPRGPEIAMARTLNRLYPRYDRVFATMYGTAMATGLPVHDLSDVFDQSAAPYFFDVAHTNDAGNALAAERIARIVTAAPRRGDVVGGGH